MVAIIGSKRESNLFASILYTRSIGYIYTELRAVANKAPNKDRIHAGKQIV